MRPGNLSDGVHAEHCAADVHCSHPDLGQHGTHGGATSPEKKTKRVEVRVKCKLASHMSFRTS
jgi:hypothetical protein